MRRFKLGSSFRRPQPDGDCSSAVTANSPRCSGVRAQQTRVQIESNVIPFHNQNLKPGALSSRGRSVVCTASTSVEVPPELVAVFVHVNVEPAKLVRRGVELVPANYSRYVEVYLGSVEHGVSVGHGELGMIVYLHITRCTGTT